MIIVEYVTNHPLLRHTRERTPEIEVTWEDSDHGSEPDPQFLVWIKSDDFERVDAAIADDPTVTDPAVLTEQKTRRLYRFDFTSESIEFALEPEIVRNGGVVEGATATKEEWQVRIRVPTREAMNQIIQYGRAHDIEFTVERVFETSTTTQGDSPRLTEPQRETLLTAVECGYLEIPRESSLEELGEQLGVSQSAVSQRFRRGVKNLIQQTLQRSET